MADHKKKWLGKLIESFVNIFESASKKLWESLSPEDQQNLKNGSGVFKVIGDNVDKTDDEIIAAIKEQYPTANIDALIDVANHLNLDIDGTVNNAVASIKMWLAEKEGSVWESAMNIGSQVASFFFSGKEAKPGIIAALAEKVYRWFVKK